MKKILNYFGAVLFVALLGINVYYSLENPMLFASEEALAQGTITEGCGTINCRVPCSEDHTRPPVISASSTTTQAECCRDTECWYDENDVLHCTTDIQYHQDRSCLEVVPYDDSKFCWKCPLVGSGT